MEQIESIQKANRQRRLAEWSQRVEACRSSGLPVGRWCQENGIAVSTYFAWQRKVFKTLWIYQCAESACPVFWKSPVRKEEIMVSDR